MSEEEEAIELTAQDMAVIDDVNDDYNEEETSEEVESDIVADDITSEDEYSDVEDSVTTEPSSTGYDRKQLEGAAAHYGLDPTKFNSEEALVNAIEVVGQTQGQLQDWNQWYQQQQEAVHRGEEVNYENEPAFRVDLDEDYDEGLKDAINDLAAKMQSHYDNQIYQLNGVINGQQHYVDQIRVQEQTNYVQSQLDNFDSAVQSLGNNELFGDKAFTELSSDSAQAKNMEALYSQAQLLASGYQAQGLQVPSLNELTEQAYKVVFHDDITKQERRRSNDRIRKASSRRLGSGSAISEKGMPSPSNDIVDNTLLKEFYENAMRENGTL